MTRLPMTAAGHVALEDELRHRTRMARPRLVQRIQHAISDDANLVENSEYQAALAEQEVNENRIADLEDSSRAPKSSTYPNFPATRSGLAPP
jgi:transcription elongation factor GreA